MSAFFACACMCVCVCASRREGIGMSSLSCLRGSQSLFKLPSGFQASHLQTGISCSLLLSPHFCLLEPPPRHHVCPRLLCVGPFSVHPTYPWSAVYTVTYCHVCAVMHLREQERRLSSRTFAHSHADMLIMANHTTTRHFRYIFILKLKKALIALVVRRCSGEEMEKHRFFDHIEKEWAHVFASYHQLTNSKTFVAVKGLKAFHPVIVVDM